MTQYDNTNRGVLFDNDRKQSENHPDMKGSLNINGVDHWFSGWWKESREGAQFLSLSIGDPKDSQQQQAPQQPQHRQQQPVRQGNRPPPRQPAPQGPGRRQPQYVPPGMDDDIPL